MADKTEDTFIANFATSITQINTLGGDYKPPNPLAEVAGMQAHHAAILTARTDSDEKDSAEEADRNARENLYKRAAPLASELVNYCKSLGLEENVFANLQTFVRDLRGRRAAPVAKPAANATAPPPKTISAAQTSYVETAEHFANLVEAVRILPGFKPEEDKFKLTTLDAFVAALRQANTAVANAAAAAATARRTLDELLYTGADSVINRLKSAKAYIAAVFKASHPVYKTITKFRFDQPKRLRPKK